MNRDTFISNYEMLCPASERYSRPQSCLMLVASIKLFIISPWVTSLVSNLTNQILFASNKRSEFTSINIDLVDKIDSEDF